MRFVSLHLFMVSLVFASLTSLFITIFVSLYFQPCVFLSLALCLCILKLVSLALFILSLSLYLHMSLFIMTFVFFNFLASFIFSFVSLHLDPCVIVFVFQIPCTFNVCLYITLYSLSYDPSRRWGRLLLCTTSYSLAVFPNLRKLTPPIPFHYAFSEAFQLGGLLLPVALLSLIYPERFQLPNPSFLNTCSRNISFWFWSSFSYYFYRHSSLALVMKRSSIWLRNLSNRTRQGKSDSCIQEEIRTKMNF